MREEQEVLRDGAFGAAADVEGELEGGEQDAGLLAADRDTFDGEAVELQRTSFGATQLELGVRGRRRGGRGGHGRGGGGHSAGGVQRALGAMARGEGEAGGGGEGAQQEGRGHAREGAHGMRAGDDGAAERAGVGRLHGDGANDALRSCALAAVAAAQSRPKTPLQLPKLTPRSHGAPLSS